MVDFLSKFLDLIPDGPPAGEYGKPDSSLGDTPSADTKPVKDALHWVGSAPKTAAKAMSTMAKAYQSAGKQLTTLKKTLSLVDVNVSLTKLGPRVSLRPSSKGMRLFANALGLKSPKRSEAKTATNTPSHDPTSNLQALLLEAKVKAECPEESTAPEDVSPESVPAEEPKPVSSRSSKRLRKAWSKVTPRRSLSKSADPSSVGKGSASEPSPQTKAQATCNIIGAARAKHLDRKVVKQQFKESSKALKEQIPGLGQALTDKGHSAENMAYVAGYIARAQASAEKSGDPEPLKDALKLVEIAKTRSVESFETSKLLVPSIEDLAREDIESIAALQDAVSSALQPLLDCDEETLASLSEFVSGELLSGFWGLTEEKMTKAEQESQSRNDFKMKEGEILGDFFGQLRGITASLVELRAQTAPRESGQKNHLVAAIKSRTEMLDEIAEPQVAAFAAASLLLDLPDPDDPLSSASNDIDIGINSAFRLALKGRRAAVSSDGLSTNARMTEAVDLIKDLAKTLRQPTPAQELGDRILTAYMSDAEVKYKPTLGDFRAIGVDPVPDEESPEYEAAAAQLRGFHAQGGAAVLIIQAKRGAEMLSSGPPERREMVSALINEARQKKDFDALELKERLEAMSDLYRESDLEEAAANLLNDPLLGPFLVKRDLEGLQKMLLKGVNVPVKKKLVERIIQEANKQKVSSGLDSPLPDSWLEELSDFSAFDRECLWQAAKLLLQED